MAACRVYTQKHREEDAQAAKHRTVTHESCAHRTTKRSTGEGISWDRLMHTAACYHRA